MHSIQRKYRKLFSIESRLGKNEYLITFKNVFKRSEFEKLGNLCDKLIDDRPIVIYIEIGNNDFEFALQYIHQYAMRKKSEKFKIYIL